MKFSRKSFNAWFSKQPDDRVFKYIDNEDCLIASWLKETKKMKSPHVVPGYVRMDNGEAHYFPKWLDYIDDVMSQIARPRFRFSVGKLRKALQP